MRDLNALGLTGRAGSVDDVGKVVRRDLRTKVFVGVFADRGILDEMDAERI